LAAWLCPDPLGELTALPQTPYLDFWGRGGEEGKGKENGTGKEEAGE